jgi:hypothetical protein
MSDAFLLFLFIVVVLVALLCCSGRLAAQAPTVGRGVCSGGEADVSDEADVSGGSGGGARLGIREPWFGMMLAGKKTVEGRLQRGAAATLAAGDVITVARSRPPGDQTEHPGPRRYETKVVRATPYRSFAELVKKEGAAALFPGKKSEKEALDEYRLHSSEADEAEVVKSGSDGHAVVAIEVAPLTDAERRALESGARAPLKSARAPGQSAARAPGRSAAAQYSW